MPIWETVLGASLQVVFDRLASRDLLEFAMPEGISRRLEKLEETLKKITQVISSAENTRQEAEVEEWLEKLRDWAYDADDFLDEVNTRAMQHVQQMKEEEEEEEEVEAGRNNAPIPFSFRDAFKGTMESLCTLRDFVCGFNSGMHSNVDKLNSRLDTISEPRDEMLRLIKKSTPRQFEAPALSFDPRVFGREREKERIIEQLKSSSGDPNVEVIPIVGMPGIGKTTLARHVFHSASLQQQEAPRFDIYGWVRVSHDFDVDRTTRDILESFTSRAPNSSGLNQLQSELQKAVEGKRFLLVLDDVWSRDYLNHWNPLRSPFRAAAPGSKILVTTRDIKVASMVRTDDDSMKIHQLGTLCDDDCWLVFWQHVIDQRNSVFESDAGRFRVKILDKCKGLPLTAKLLGGLLRGESPGQGWEDILNSSIWDPLEGEISGQGDRMLPVVMLSYFHLPPQLKRCFSYCSVLPKDYEFGEEEVVLLWMAEGLVLPERGGEQTEVRGAKYFRELVSRSLFQPSPNKPSRFLMHDLINDMAEIVAGKSCLKFDRYRTIDSTPVQQARYLSFRHITLKKQFETFERTKYLRAFLSFDSWRSSNLTNYVPLELLMKLKYLRVLCLSWHYSIVELPEDIGNLIHLRLVDLSYTSIRRLPESTSNLYNLQTLKLRGCFKLEKLPSQMRKLVNLRNLDCSGADSLVAMPVEMGKLTSLQKLSNFIVGEGLEQGIGQLKDLSYLKGNISISFLENVHDSKEAREAKLMSKEGLQLLELKWKTDSDHGDLPDTGVSLDILKELQPAKKLEELVIDGYGGASFPSWVGDDSFSKMRVIELENCKMCTTLPPLGKLPALEKIRIRKMAGIEWVGEEFYGKEREAFPSLKILKFEGMKNWSTWSHPASGGRYFACLQELLVIDCPKLSICLPDGINVEKLIVRDCEELLIAPRQSFSKMDIQGCRVELMGCLNEDGEPSQLLPFATSNLLLSENLLAERLLERRILRQFEEVRPSLCLPLVGSRLMIGKVDVVEAFDGSARMTMNIISNNEDVVGALHQMMILGSLTFLEMANILRLTHLETLRICLCEELTSLWKMDDGEMEIGGRKIHFLSSLRVLEVEECSQIVCLVPQDGEEDDADMISEKEEEEKQGKQQYLGLPCGLESLMITKCDKLEKLPSDLLHGLTSLQFLYIFSCHKLEKLPSDLRNLTSLRVLQIWDCRRLCCLTEMGFPSTLELLNIEGCESLTCLSISSSAAAASSSAAMEGNGMPLRRSLKQLDISNCKNLESLVGVGGTASTTADSFPSLQRVYIGACPKLKSLPESVLIRSLKCLCIARCENLGELSISFHHLTALEVLEISGWPAGLLSILQGGPNPNSLPPNLRNLEIGGGAGPSVTPNDEVFSVPLPSSLTTLRISKFKKLSPEAFQNLTSLRALSIRNCPELTSIPDQLLPPSLRSLDIWECPLLVPQLAKGKGRYWPKVEFIPRVAINGRSIFLEEATTNVE